MFPKYGKQADTELYSGNLAWDMTDKIQDGGLTEIYALWMLSIVVVYVFLGRQLR